MQSVRQAVLKATNDDGGTLVQDFTTEKSDYKSFQEDLKNLQVSDVSILWSDVDTVSDDANTVSGDAAKLRGDVGAIRRAVTELKQDSSPSATPAGVDPRQIQAMIKFGLQVASGPPTLAREAQQMVNSERTVTQQEQIACRAQEADPLMRQIDCAR